MSFLPGFSVSALLQPVLGTGPPLLGPPLLELLLAPLLLELPELELLLPELLLLRPPLLELVLPEELLLLEVLPLELLLLELLLLEALPLELLRPAPLLDPPLLLVPWLPELLPPCVLGSFVPAWSSGPQAAPRRIAPNARSRGAERFMGATLQSAVDDEASRTGVADIEPRPRPSGSRAPPSRARSRRTPSRECGIRQFAGGNRQRSASSRTAATHARTG
jgi:hypothetical protein